MLEVGQWPITTTLTGVTQALLDRATVIRRTVQLDVKQCQAQITRGFLHALLPQLAQAIINPWPGQLAAIPLV
ncbi:hypothetical protein D3C80_1706520 [compost metagenome]